MKSLKKYCCLGLIIVLALSLVVAGTGAIPGKEYEWDSSKQNAITAYALSFNNDVDMQYVWGGWGGRTPPYGSEEGENGGYWSLEQCKKYISEWSTNPDDNQYKRYGTDCTGFVCAVFQHFGIYPNIEFEDTYPEVSAENAVPGDVVVYWDWEKGVYGPVHAALYIGDDLVIHVNSRMGYSGRETQYDGYMTPEKKQKINYCHISPVSYNGEEWHFFRVVDDIQEKYPITAEDAEAISSIIIAEREMPGMPEDPLFRDSAITIKLPDASDLTAEQQHHIITIGKLMHSDAPTYVKMIGATFTFIGIALMVYGILLILAYIFDSVNSFIDISLVKLLTFGSMQVIPKSEYNMLSEKERKGYVLKNKIFMISIICIVLGALTVSGVLPSLVYKLTEHFR